MAAGWLPPGQRCSRSAREAGQLPGQAGVVSGWAGCGLRWGEGVSGHPYREARRWGVGGAGGRPALGEGWRHL